MRSHSVTSMHEAAAAWLISKFMMDAFFAKQQSLTLINVILGPSIVGKNMEFPLQIFMPIIHLSCSKNDLNTI